MHHGVRSHTEEAMKKSVSWTAVFGFVLFVPAAVAFAGAPDNPGGHGRFIGGVASTSQGIGDVASDPVEGRSNNGDSVRKAKNDEGGNPNSANDNGSGND
jgi:hypothetical protein